MSTETISLGLPPLPRTRRSRADIEAANPVTSAKRCCWPLHADTAPALIVP